MSDLSYMIVKSAKPSIKPTKTDKIIVFTDGACVNNGRKNAMAGLGVYFSENDPRNCSMKVMGKQSNNTAEVKAIIKAQEILHKEIEQGKKIVIYSDSKYAIRACGEYGAKLSAKNFPADVPNVDLVEEAYNLFKNKPNIIFKHINAHTGGTDVLSLGNDGADRLANLAIGRDPSSDENAKIYLKVPFAKKDEAKGLGAKWDPKKKKWYCMGSNPNKTELVTLFQNQSF